MEEPTIIQHIHIHVEPMLVTPAVAAHYLSCSTRHVRDLVEAGLLIPVKPETVNRKGNVSRLREAKL